MAALQWTIIRTIISAPDHFIHIFTSNGKIKSQRVCLLQCYFKLTTDYFKFTFCAVYNASTQGCAAKGYATRQWLRNDFVTTCALDAIFATLKSIVDDILVRYSYRHTYLNKVVQLCSRMTLFACTSCPYYRCSHLVPFFERTNRPTSEQGTVYLGLGTRQPETWTETYCV